MDLTNLISVWELNEASGNALDSHGSNTLTETSGTIDAATGLFGGARDFEAGDTERFEIADNASLSVTDIDWLVTAWVYAESLGGVNRDILAKWPATNGEYLFGYTASDRFRFTVRNAANNANATVEANSFGSPSVGVWYFVVGWHDSVANTLNIQVNDGPVDSVSHSGGCRDAGTAFTIGARNQGGTGDAFWDGLIQQVTFWKRILTAPERSEIFNSGAGLPYPWVAASGQPAMRRFTRSRSGLWLPIHRPIELGRKGVLVI